ncbi:MAG: UDP-N-acetylmuramate--L-alanine ligase [Gemmatimonadetes bacterium]|nr:UDP-N-acetylmuramate--L-alanine ligase [Gemmatimonadota bacterium]
MSPAAPAPSRPPESRDLPAPGGHVHLMGIGGAGMRGLAVLLDHAGYEVSGCDRGSDELVELAARGIAVARGHDASHGRDAHLLVRTSAVPGDAEEVRAAIEAGVPVLKRAEALGALVNGRPLIGVAGTHGKTTITGMTGLALEAAGLDPTVLVGGHVPAWGGFTRLGAGPGVVEADEFDRSFLELDATLAVISSLEPEHLDTYGDFDAVRAAFRAFAARAVDRDGVLFCADDEGARALADELGSGRGYGFAADAWCRIERRGASACRLAWPDGSIDIELTVPGRHNQQNAAAAFCAGLLQGGEPDRLAEGLRSFAGIGRRLERLGAWDDLVIFDDYAHHPTEVAASIAALRDAHPEAALTVVFQPHLYTRTRDFAADFGAALEAADQARVLPIYPAREAPIEGVTSSLIVDAAGSTVAHIDRPEAEALPGASVGPRVIAYMGAGDVTAIAHAAAERRVDGAVGT